MVKKTIVYRNGGTIMGYNHGIRTYTPCDVEITVSDDGHVWYNDDEMKYSRMGRNKPYIYAHSYDKDKKMSLRIPVARAVCQAYHPTEGMEELQVDHADDDTLNNNANNLRWTTRRENNGKEAARIRRSLNPHKRMPHTDQVVLAVDPLTGREWIFRNGAVASAHIGCSNTLCTLALNGQIPAAKKWKLRWISIEEVESADGINNYINR